MEEGKNPAARLLNSDNLSRVKCLLVLIADIERELQEHLDMVLEESEK